ncbi:hypothetical protein GCM10010428_45310 [Actinosynnema pretiosum subsp. pretiosum]
MTRALSVVNRQRTWRCSGLAGVLQCGVRLAWVQAYAATWARHGLDSDGGPGTGTGLEAVAPGIRNTIV